MSIFLSFLFLAYLTITLSSPIFPPLLLFTAAHLFPPSLLRPTATSAANFTSLPFPVLSSIRHLRPSLFRPENSCCPRRDLMCLCFHHPPQAIFFPLAAILQPSSLPHLDCNRSYYLQLQLPLLSHSSAASVPRPFFFSTPSLSYHFSSLQPHHSLS
ncbi:hypothetical protein AMTRI_Chr05g70650 [Amborella trichopoda]